MSVNQPTNSHDKRKVRLKHGSIINDYVIIKTLQMKCGKMHKKFTCAQRPPIFHWKSNESTLPFLIHFLLHKILTSQEESIHTALKILILLIAAKLSEFRGRIQAFSRVII